MKASEYECMLGITQVKVSPKAYRQAWRFVFVSKVPGPFAELSRQRFDTFRDGESAAKKVGLHRHGLTARFLKKRAA